MDDSNEIDQIEISDQENTQGLTWGKAILLALVFLGIQIIAAIPLAFTGMNDIGMAMTLIASYIGTIYIGSRWVGMPDFSDRGIGFDIVSIIGAILLMMAAKFAIGIPMEFIPGYESMLDGYIDTFGNLGVLTMLIAATIGPVAEEVIFRGMIQKGLMRNYTSIFAIVFSSVIFGVIHMIPIQVVSAMIMGLVLAWIYYKTKSLWIPIIVHVINNSIAFLFIDDMDDISSSMFRNQMGSDLGALGVLLVSIVLGYFIYRFLDKRWNERTAIELV